VMEHKVTFVLTIGQQFRLNNNMANIDVNTTVKYWIEGTSG